MSTEKTVPKLLNRPATLDEWGDIVQYLGNLDTSVSKLNDRLHAMSGKLDSIDSRLDKVMASLDASNGALDKILSRLDGDLTFKPGAEFYSTFGGRIGEEVRASLRAEISGVGTQMFSAFESHLKQNPVKMPTGMGLVPWMTALGALASVGHLAMSYYAAQHYVPHDVDVKVNGVAVPQNAGGQVHQMNGHRQPARAVV